MIEKRWPAEAGHRAFSCGAADGARTRDTRNHNPVLYQLSYGRHTVEGRGVIRAHVPGVKPLARGGGLV